MSFNRYLSTAALFAMFAGCADFGPFRASSDGAGSGTGADGGTSDGATHDASTTEIDGAVVSNPVLLATVTDSPSGLHATGGYVYWLATQAVRRVAATGGAVADLDAGGYALQLTARDGRIAWTTTDAVRTANPSFSSSTLLTSTMPYNGSITSSADHLYFSRKESSSFEAIDRVEWTGGSPETVQSSIGAYPQVAVSGANLMWTTYGDSANEVRKSPLSAPTTSSLVATTGAGGFDLLRASDAVVCWIERPDINVYSFDIWCLRNNNKVRIAQGLYQLFSMAVTDTAVFWAGRSTPSTAHLFRYNFTTGGTTTHETSAPGPLTVFVATDATYLYSFEVDTDDTTYRLWRQPLP
jgi:hypothetical protein